MICGLYSIYDRLAGTFSEPIVAVKDELAVRRFDYVMSNSAMVAQDCDLYLLGYFDTESGVLSPGGPDSAGRPVFIKRWEAKQV